MLYLFFRCVITWRYWLDRCVNFLTTQELGLFFNTFMPIFMVPGIRHRSREQGIGLHSPEEIYQICRKDCAILDGVLGRVTPSVTRFFFLSLVE